jgi:hypothetical protein
MHRRFFLSRKPGFLLSAMHSRAFRWFSAAPVPWFSYLTAESDLEILRVVNEEGGGRDGLVYFHLFTF